MWWWPWPLDIEMKERTLEDKCGQSGRKWDIVQVRHFNQLEVMNLASFCSAHTHLFTFKRTIRNRPNFCRVYVHFDYHRCPSLDQTAISALVRGVPFSHQPTDIHRSLNRGGTLIYGSSEKSCKCLVSPYPSFHFQKDNCGQT